MNYKSYGDIERIVSLVKPETVLDTFVESYLQGQECEAWIEVQNSEWAIAYPEETNGDPIFAEDGTTLIGYEQIPNPDYIEFDKYMKQTESVEVGTKPAYDDEGNEIGSEPVYSDVLIRKYAPVPVDVQDWKDADPMYDTYKKVMRTSEVETLTVTTSTGMYDADELSQDRMARVVAVANFQYNKVVALGASPAEAYAAVYLREVEWKGADNVFRTLTIEELAEASQLALEQLSITFIKYG